MTKDDRTKEERRLLGQLGMAKRWNNPEAAQVAARGLVSFMASRAVDDVERFLIESGVPDNEIDGLLWNAFKEVFYGGEETPK